MSWARKLTRFPQSRAPGFLSHSCIVDLSPTCLFSSLPADYFPWCGQRRSEVVKRTLRHRLLLWKAGPLARRWLHATQRKTAAVLVDLLTGQQWRNWFRWHPSRQTVLTFAPVPFLRTTKTVFKFEKCTSGLVESWLKENMKSAYWEKEQVPKVKWSPVFLNSLYLLWLRVRLKFQLNFERARLNWIELWTGHIELWTLSDWTLNLTNPPTWPPKELNKPLLWRFFNGSFGLLVAIFSTVLGNLRDAVLVVSLCQNFEGKKEALRGFQTLITWGTYSVFQEKTKSFCAPKCWPFRSLLPPKKTTIFLRAF